MKKPRLTEIALLDHATGTFRTRTHRDITGQTDQEAKPNVDPLSYNKESSFFIPTMNSYNVFVKPKRFGKWELVEIRRCGKRKGECFLGMHFLIAVGNVIPVTLDTVEISIN